MPSPRIITMDDAVCFATDFAKSISTGCSSSMLREAIDAAWNDVGDAFEWSFLKKHGRIHLHAAQSTGTVAYDHTGGTYERQLTLTGSTWPSSWVEDATVRIDDMACRVESYKTSTVVTLDVELNPGQDVASGTSYVLFPEYYRLPPDFISLEKPWTDSFWQQCRQVSWDDMLALTSYYGDTGTPQWYCIREVADIYGQMGLYLNPPSDSDEPVDFCYRRSPREVRYSGHNKEDYQGTVSVTADSKVVQGSGTAFNEAMIGAIFRVASSSDSKPTALWGTNPWIEQRSIVGVASTTSLTLDGEISTTRSDVKYVVTDPIDMDRACWNAFRACIRKHLAVQKDLKNAERYINLYELELARAKGTDNRATESRVIGRGARMHIRLADTTTGDDVDD